MLGVTATLGATAPTTMALRAVDAVLSTRGLPPLVPPDLAVSKRADEGLASLGALADGADRRLALERTESVQAEDAVFKVAVLAAFAARIGGGAVLLELPTTRAWLAFWASVDVVATLGAVDVKRLIAAHDLAVRNRLAAAMGEEVLVGVDRAVEELIPVLQREVDAATGTIDAVVKALAPLVPGLVAPGPDVVGVVGVRADGLPVYAWLAARLATEVAAKSATGTS